MAIVLIGLVVVTAVIASLFLTGVIFGAIWIIRKIDLELGAKIDEFLKNF